MCHIQNTIHFYFNNKRKITVDNINFKNVNNINIDLGYNRFKNEKFNGIIGPVLIFNSPNDNQKVYEKIINILFSYEEYNGVSVNDLELKKFIKEAKKSLGNLILYINPEIVLNHLKFKDKNKLRDYQIYNNCFDGVYDISHSNIYYEFNNQANINNLIKIENNLSKIFINNNGYNFLVFNIECIYNYLLISYNGNSDIDTNTFSTM
jgi:hypothetical protein